MSTEQEIEKLRDALLRAAMALLEVGDDYPGTAVQKWCHKKAQAALEALVVKP